jgi:hypothetical protein
MNWPTKLKPAPVPYPNGGALKAVKDAKIARAAAEEKEKEAKKVSK